MTAPCNKTTLTQCSLCQNFQHCTAAGYCNCGAYSAREGQGVTEVLVPVLLPHGVQIKEIIGIKGDFLYALRNLDALLQELDDIRTRESEELADMLDPSCYGAGYSAGAIATVDAIKAFLREHS